MWSNCNNCAAADIVPHSGRKIWGGLYDIPDHLIRRETSGNRKSLDAIEGEGGNYRRTNIAPAYPDGKPVEADPITYVVQDRKVGLRTSLEYAGHIINGLREHNVPEEYVQYAKGRVVANNPDIRDEIEGL